jgi:Asp-tRNA(Asn)/Glu-tRNA(Gln) amidotransferase A subunit family amidase
MEEQKSEEQMNQTSEEKTLAAKWKNMRTKMKIGIMKRYLSDAEKDPDFRKAILDEIEKNPSLRDRVVKLAAKTE